MKPLLLQSLTLGALSSKAGEEFKGRHQVQNIAFSCLTRVLLPERHSALEVVESLGALDDEAQEFTCTGV